MTEEALIPAGALDVAEKAKKSTAELWNRAAVLTVSNGEEYIVGAELHREIAERRRELDATRLGITRPMDEAKSRIMELFRPTMDQVKAAEDAVKKELITYSDRIEREARAEAERIEREAREAREKAEQEAAALRDEGKESEARALEYEALTAPPPAMAAATVARPVVAGSVVSGTWKAEVTDKMALIKFIAEGKAPADWVDVNMPRLNAEAKSKREAMAVPGVRAYKQANISAR